MEPTQPLTPDDIARANARFDREHGNVKTTNSDTNEDFREDVFGDAARMRQPEPKGEDIYRCEAYEKFVESMVPHCHCSERNRPCDGVLAGGVCDGIKDDTDSVDDDD